MPAEVSQTNAAKKNINSDTGSMAALPGREGIVTHKIQAGHSKCAKLIPML